MINTIVKYAAAIEAGHPASIENLLSNTIQLKTPGAIQSITGKKKISGMLGTASLVINDFKVVRIYRTNDNWFLVLLEGTVDGQALQILDNVFINKEDTIDAIDIFLRPSYLADILLERITALSVK